MQNRYQFRTIPDLEAYLATSDLDNNRTISFVPGFSSSWALEVAIEFIRTNPAAMRVDTLDLRELVSDDNVGRLTTALGALLESSQRVDIHYMARLKILVRSEYISEHNAYAVDNLVDLINQMANQRLLTATSQPMDTNENGEGNNFGFADIAGFFAATATDLDLMTPLDANKENEGDTHNFDFNF